MFLFVFLFVCDPSPALAKQHLDGDGKITLYHVHSKKNLSIQFRKPNGRYDSDALKQIEEFLRCRVTHKTHPISTDLLDLIDHIQDHFEDRTIHVLSAYRSPEFNESLRKKGRKVASKSLHMQGYAMDIFIPDIHFKKLRDYALSLKKGGVGSYPHNGFVHVDVGRFRTW